MTDQEDVVIARGDVIPSSWIPEASEHHGHQLRLLKVEHYDPAGSTIYARARCETCIIVPEIDLVLKVDG